MQVAIVEDEPLAADRLKIILAEYDNHIETVVCLESVEDAVKWFKQNKLPDLIFLDIELGDGNSFEIFQQCDIKCPIIFTTAYDQYAIDAFKLNSIDYLLKPVTQDAMTKALEKYKALNVHSVSASLIQQLLEGRSGHADKAFKNRFLVKLGSRLFFLDVNQVAWFFADDKTVYLVSTEGVKYAVDFTLEKLEQMLNPTIFFRLNRKIIVHANCIKEIKTFINSRLKIHLSAGKQYEEVVVSRERVQDFKEWAGG